MKVEEVNLYRMVHKANVAYILQNGMFCRDHIAFDPTNIFIGNSLLTEQRKDFKIPIEDCGNLGEYVPFYYY